MQTTVIKSIKRLGKAHCYDLKVQNNHNFLLANRILTHNSGSFRELKAVKNINDIIRKKQINMLFSSPDIKEHTNIFVFETLATNEVTRQCYLMAYKKIREPAEGLKPLGIVTTGLAPKSFLKDYERKKDKFIEKFQQTQSGQRQKEWGKAAQEVIKLPEFLETQNDKERIFIAQPVIGEYTKEEQGIILGRANMLMREKMREEKKKNAPWNQKLDRDWETFTKDLKRKGKS